MEECPSTPLAIFFVNVVTVWISGFLARSNLNIAVNFYGLVLANAAVHIVSSLVVAPFYNPGLGTALGLFLPGSWWAFNCFTHIAKQALGISITWSRAMRATLIVGILGHVSIMASFVLGGKGLLSEGMVCFFQVLNLLLLILPR